MDPVDYLISRGGQQYGPYPLSVLQSMASQGQLAPTDLAWCEGMPSWVPLSQLLGGQPPAQQQYPQQPVMQQGAAYGPPAGYAPAGGVNAWLGNARAKLGAEGFEFFDNVSSYNERFLFVARRSRFEMTKFGIAESFFAFADLGSPDVARLQAFSAAAFDYAAKNQKNFLPRGFFKFVVCYCVAIAGSGARPDVIDSVRNNTPAKHWSSAEVPILFDAAQGQLYYFEKTPVWGAAYYHGFRKQIEQLLR